MAGHSHWAGIKHKKGVKDQKRGVLFSKLLNAISIAARDEPSPDFNPRLRTAVEKARQASVPQDNIDRAIYQASEKSDNLEELMFEAYGPGGAALLIAAITGNRNRTVAEVKKILSENSAKWAEPGSVAWAFENIGPGKIPKAKFAQELSPEDKTSLASLVKILNEHEDVQGVYTNSKR